MSLAVSAALLAGGLRSETPAEANHGATLGVVDILAIDADAAGNAAKTLGTINECVSGDVTDTLAIDVVVDEVHPDDGLAGFGVRLLFDPAVVHVTSVIDNGTSVLMGEDGSGGIFSLSQNPNNDDPNDEDAIPEGSDGSILLAAADFGDTSPNNGAGILARVTLELAGPGIADLGFGTTSLAAINNSKLTVNQMVTAQVAAGEPCPGSVPKTDLQVSDVVVDAPAAGFADVAFQVTADALVTNLGPDPAVTDVTVTLDPPADCTSPTPFAVTATGIALGVSEGARAPAPATGWDLTCSSAGPHLISATVQAVPVGSQDATQSNNQASGEDSITLTAEADLSFASLTLSAPPQEFVGSVIELTGTATLHNNGPYAAAGAATTVVLSMPPDCTITPGADVIVTPLTLTASQSVTLDGSTLLWQVICSTPGPHTFSVSGGVAPTEALVDDPVSNNNSAAANATLSLFIGACQEDPNPESNPLQNLSPQLLLLISALTAEGTPTPEEQQIPLDCRFNMKLDDNGGGPVDDCEVSGVETIPCDIKIDVTIDEVGGSPVGESGVKLNPISVNFLPAAFDFADDSTIPNGAVAGEGAFNIRSDVSVSIACHTDVFFNPRPGFKAAIPGGVESNTNDALIDPLVWPNDLNGERALVEFSFDINPLTTELTLWSRTVVALEIPGALELPLNIMIWRIDDPTLQLATGAKWIMLALPSDAVNPDPPGLMGGDPDADDPPGDDELRYCTPTATNLTLFGEVAGVTRQKCILPGTHMGWGLMDPNAVDFTGDDSWRSNVSTCSLDADGDGLTSEEETYYGTDPLNMDSDADGHVDGADNCPAAANADQANYDGDRDGDVCDPDVDGDGAANAGDLCPGTALDDTADPNGCSQAQVDADGDGVCNPGAPSGGPFPPCTGSDLCPSTATGQAVDAAGCSQPQVDADGDGVCNAGAPSGGPGGCTGSDLCPFTASGQAVDANGCSQAQVDTDGDGICNSGVPSGGPGGCTGSDNCRTVPNSDQANADGDDYGDACDGCPTTITAWPTNGLDDIDCDGFDTPIENLIGTLFNQACAATPDPNDESPQAWPVDFDDNQIVDVTDVLTFKPYFFMQGDAAPARHDIVPDDIIDVSDVLTLKPFFFVSCS
jgi:hypothetical protein